ncbi:MAG: serine protease [Candidatus Rokuibacteriota bacterium]|nr:MAG: serine protease [Candidatus Rokubacteria bacterium]
MSIGTSTFWRPTSRRALWPLLLSILLAGAGAAGIARAESPRAASCAETLPDIFDRVSPAVVSISATSINPYRLSERVSHIAGSGVLIDASGLILTNAHVAFGRQSITVTLDNGTRLLATLVGADPIFDLAVLRIPKPSGPALPTVALGDSDRTRVGEEVVAIGNPLGLDQTLTRGIVSGMNRVLPETPFSLLEPLIQTDAPINPGNSGGPLLNRCGEVIGINTAVIADAQNIGFAVPSNLVKTTLAALLSHGRVVRPWVGFHGQLVGSELKELLKAPLVDGLLVEVIEPGSPAETAGLQGGRLELELEGRAYLLGGDIITTLNGRALDSLEALTEAMRALRVGADLTLRVFREGSYREVRYTLPERPLLPGDVPGDRPLAGVISGGSRRAAQR